MPALRPVWILACRTGTFERFMINLVEWRANSNPYTLLRTTNMGKIIFIKKD